MYSSLRRMCARRCSSYSVSEDASSPPPGGVADGSAAEGAAAAFLPRGGMAAAAGALRAQQQCPVRCGISSPMCFRTAATSVEWVWGTEEATRAACDDVDAPRAKQLRSACVGVRVTERRGSPPNPRSPAAQRQDMS